MFNKNLCTVHRGLEPIITDHNLCANRGRRESRGWPLLLMGPAYPRQKAPRDPKASRYQTSDPLLQSILTYPDENLESGCPYVLQSILVHLPRSQWLDIISALYVCYNFRKFQIEVPTGISCTNIWMLHTVQNIRFLAIISTYPFDNTSNTPTNSYMLVNMLWKWVQKCAHGSAYISFSEANKKKETAHRFWG